MKRRRRRRNPETWTDTILAPATGAAVGMAGIIGCTQGSFLGDIPNHHVRNVIAIGTGVAALGAVVGGVAIAKRAKHSAYGVAMASGGLVTATMWTIGLVRGFFFNMKNMDPPERAERIPMQLTPGAASSPFTAAASVLSGVGR